jgi:hypothetical protein
MIAVISFMSSHGFFRASCRYFSSAAQRKSYAIGASRNRLGWLKSPAARRTQISRQTRACSAIRSTELVRHRMLPVAFLMAMPACAVPVHRRDKVRVLATMSGWQNCAS